MNSRFKGFGAFGSKRTTSSNKTVGPTSHTPSASTTTLAPSPPVNGAPLTPPGSTSSTTSLPMNQGGQTGLGRPPSYTYNPNAPRAASPLPPPQQQHMAHAPPPINTGAYPQGHPALAGGAAAQPPGYGGGYGQVAPPQPTLGQYGGRGAAVEVEGAGRSKAQLIVGIDFVSSRKHATLHDERSVHKEERYSDQKKGYYILRCCVCICNKYRSERRYHHRVAWCW